MQQFLILFFIVFEIEKVFSLTKVQYLQFLLNIAIINIIIKVINNIIMIFFTDILVFLKSYFSKKKFYFFLKNLVNFFITQIILTIAMIPLYSEWGIPLSIWSFFGNIIFAPFLSIFLIFSLILFFGFIFNLTFYPIVFFLKKFLKFWIFLMNFINENSTIYFFFPNHPWIYYLSCWSLFIILIFCNFKKKFTQFKFLLLSISFLLICCSISFFIKKKDHFIAKDDFSEKISIFHKTKNGIHIFDYKTKIQNSNKFKNYLIYNISKEWSKNFGNTKILSYHFKKIKINIFNEIKNHCNLFFSNQISIYNYFEKN